MPSLIDLRRRIRSVKNTQQITKAMKMVSAAKLRRAQERVIAARPYAGVLRQMLANVAGAAIASGEVTDPLLAQREEKRIQLVLVSGDKGLAGAFNTNVIKTAQKFIADHPHAEVTVELVGRKGRDFFRRRPQYKVSGELIGAMNKVQFSDAGGLAREIATRFRNGETDAVYVVNNEFKSVMAATLATTKVLPVEIPKQTAATDYIFEQPPAEILGRLLPQYVEVEIYRAMIESAAAEHAARMTAMDAATRNAGEMIDKLTLKYNRTRQAMITKELIEIISGAEAL